MRLLNAIRAFVETLGGAPIFDPEDDGEPITPEQWARAELGVVGPRGRAVEA